MAYDRLVRWNRLVLCPLAIDGVARPSGRKIGTQTWLRTWTMLVNSPILKMELKSGRTDRTNATLFPCFF